VAARPETSVDFQRLALELTIDPGNPETVYDGLDGRNSVLRVVPKNGDGLASPAE
jgi:hypothetical protein